MAGVLSLGSADLFRQSDKKARVKLTRLSPKDDSPSETLALQYWPETISDTKATNWANKPVPGGNLPLYSWINGGERIISFQAVFTTDVDVTKWPLDVTSSRVNDDFVGDLKQKGLEARNIDIRGALLWLRSFLMPTYNPDGTYLPPPKARLEIPGSRIGLYAGGSSTTLNTDSIVAILTQCDFDYRAFFPNGVPRIVGVSLSFAQLSQYKGIVEFVGANSKIQQNIKSGGDGMAPYLIGKT